MEVFIVELCRQYRDNEVMECGNIHVASSEDKAFEWASDNLFFLNEDEEEALFFTVSSNVLDADVLTETRVLGWMGREGEICRDEIPAYVREALEEAGVDL